MTLKIYTKGERVLRIEVIVHNTKEYRWGGPCRALAISSFACLTSGEILERGRMPGRLLYGGPNSGKPAVAH